MIRFRGSSTGYCTRKLVLSQLDPSLVMVPDGRQPFLDAGHNLQEAAEAFLMKRLPSSWRLLLDRREEEVRTSSADWYVVGHVDGVLEYKPTGDTYLLEVKAVKDANFKKILRSPDWREPYKSYGYESQAQTYLHASGAKATAFVFYNRNTSEMMGPWEIDHPLWTQRPDMMEEADLGKWNAIVRKLDQAVEYINQGEAPDECDSVGYCFFCGVQGKGMKRDTTRRIELDADYDLEDYDWFSQKLEAIALHKRELYEVFIELKADEIIVDGVAHRKADYE